MPRDRNFSVTTTGRIRELLDLVKFRDWRFVLEEKSGAELFLVVEFDEPCNVTGDAAVQRSRKWRLSTFMTASEVVQTAFLAVLTAMEHETREQFLYRDAAIFGPHFDVEALHALTMIGAEDRRSAITTEGGRS